MIVKRFLIILAFCSSSVFAADGAATYSTCKTCHGADGKTVYLGKVPAIAGRSEETLIEQLKAFQAGTRNEYGMGGLMSTQVKLHLKTEEDLKAVAAYIAALE